MNKKYFVEVLAPDGPDDATWEEAEVFWLLGDAVVEAVEMHRKGQTVRVMEQNGVEWTEMLRRIS